MRQNGFTLLETLAVVAMTGILAASAYGGYSKHLVKKDEAMVTKAIYEAAQKLEKHRGDNFSYAGYAESWFVFPEGATGNKIKYSVSILDSAGNNASISASSAVGRDYIVRAISTSNTRYSYLYTSTGKRCKNKNSSRITASDCGSMLSGGSTW